MYGYDDYSAEQIDYYMTGCAPKVMGIHREYEGNDDYSANPIYNCDECDNRECGYWNEYNFE